MSQNNYKETEQAALEEERKEINWQLTYGKLQEIYFGVMDQLFQENTEESRLQLKEIIRIRHLSLPINGKILLQS